MPLDAKALGAYYTPEAVADALVRWAVRDPADLLLDPSSGDGRFVARHPNSVGVERDPASVAQASVRAPHATVVEGDFFTWASDDRRRFDCAAGNPPFIRYQRFTGATRQTALEYCRRLGIVFSGLSSSWAPFIVAAASKLRAGGRIAFVVPAEIGHAPYAGPLLDYLVANFGSVHLVAIKEKIFPRLSADCWLLFADNAGCHADGIRLSKLERFDPDRMPPAVSELISVEEWRVQWRGRLRPFLLPARIRSLYERMAADPGAVPVRSDRAGRHRVRQRRESLLSSAPVRRGAFGDTRRIPRAVDQEQPVCHRWGDKRRRHRTLGREGRTGFPSANTAAGTGAGRGPGISRHR